MRWRDVMYRYYERRLVRGLEPEHIPGHIGVLVDGNRRWAKALGEDSAHGHRAGAEKILEFLGWCEEAGVKHVTLWLLSTDNLSRPAREIEALLGIIEGLVSQIAQAGNYRVSAVGALSLLPPSLTGRLQEIACQTEVNTGLHVNAAIGYGGRREIIDAVQSLLRAHDEKGTSLTEVADSLTVEDLAAHLYTAGIPDPDLVIRTSGEQRLSGFLLWQSAHSEFYFCEALWPAFRRIDFLRALRSYADRERRFGA